MLHTTFVRVDDDALPQIREWLALLPERREELRAAYRAEGTRHEQFFLVRGVDGPVLVLITELADLEHGAASFLRSHLPIDVEFKQLIQETRGGDADPELLFDSASVLGD